MFKAPETAAGVVMIFWFIAVELAYSIGASTIDKTSLCVMMIAVKIEILPRQAKNLQKKHAGANQRPSLTRIAGVVLPVALPPELFGTRPFDRLARTLDRNMAQFNSDTLTMMAIDN